MSSRRTQPARPAPAPRKRREAREPTRREEVLETALELIASHGVAGASLELADAALVADDAGDDAERRASLCEARALLVVELDP